MLDVITMAIADLTITDGSSRTFHLVSMSLVLSMENTIPFRIGRCPRNPFQVHWNLGTIKTAVRNMRFDRGGQKYADHRIHLSPFLYSSICFLA